MGLSSHRLLIKRVEKMTQQFACVFPGQGSQSKGMLSDFAEQYPSVMASFAKASEVLGYDLWELIQTDPENKLNQTEYTQPALLAAGYSLWQVFQEQVSALPAFVAGHSLGEYTAMVCSGAMDFQDAVKIVSLRGRLMQQAVPEGIGAMAAIIGLDDETVAKLCQENSSDDVMVVAANFNAPGQVVVSGHTEAVKKLMDVAKPAGAKLVKQLPLSVPSHCPLMQPAAEQLAKALDDVAISMPSIPLVHNVSVAVATNEAELREALVKQLYSPVRWTETIEYLQTQGVETIYECGPGKVLTGLNKRIAKGLDSQAMTLESLQALA